MPVSCRVKLRWANAARCDDEVVVVTHAAACFYNLALVVANDFYPLEVHAEGKAELGHVCRVAIDGLSQSLAHVTSKVFC